MNRLVYMASVVLSYSGFCNSSDERLYQLEKYRYGIVNHDKLYTMKELAVDFNADNDVVVFVNSSTVMFVNFVIFNKIQSELSVRYKIEFSSKMVVHLHDR